MRNFLLLLGLSLARAATAQPALPPAADDVLATSLADPGGAIFLHGANVSDGCLPLTDAGIEEVYLLAVAARAAGIGVRSFPFSLTESELSQRAGSPHLAFWRSLVAGYVYFETHYSLRATEER